MLPRAHTCFLECCTWHQDSFELGEVGSKCPPESEVLRLLL